MKELIEKLSSYNIFNYLLPGVLFVVMLKMFTSYNLITENLFSGAFLYYFVGLVISRVGSLIIEPKLKKIAKHEDYSDFIKASKEDSKIDLLSEINNMYRTIVSMILLLLISKAYEQLAIKFEFLNYLLPYLLMFLLLILFVFSYMKQTDYITKRIKHYKNNNTIT